MLNIIVSESFLGCSEMFCCNSLEDRGFKGYMKNLDRLNQTFDVLRLLTIHSLLARWDWPQKWKCNGFKSGKCAWQEIDIPWLMTRYWEFSRRNFLAVCMQCGRNYAEWPLCHTTSAEQFLLKNFQGYVISHGLSISCQAHFPDLIPLCFISGVRPDSKCIMSNRRTWKVWFSASKNFMYPLKLLSSSELQQNISEQARCDPLTIRQALVAPLQICVAKVVKIQVYYWYLSINPKFHSIPFEKYPFFCILRPVGFNYFFTNL